MELRHLSHFIAVADEGSFTAAARRLHLSQPGVSASVKALEDELGSELIIRQRQRAQLTEAGRVVYAGARRALAGLDNVRVQLRTRSAPTEPLRIGSIPSLPSLYLAAAIGRFSAAHPGATVHVRVDLPAALIDSVADESVDLALVTLPDEAHDGVAITPLSTSPMVLACPMGHHLAGRTGVRIDELADEDFVDFTSALSARRVNDDAFRYAGITRSVRATCNDIASLLELVAHGIGVAIVPRPLATATRVPIAQVPIDGTTLAWTLALAVRAGGVMSESGRAFQAVLTDTPVL